MAQRLTGTVIPEHYALWFAPDLEKATFRGHETITVQVKSAATAITLHAAEIEFGETTLTAGGTAQTARVTLDAQSETATLTVSRPIPAGAATIQITYTGILNDKLRGFYLSRANGRSYAVTQMEATDARRAFPSFDEPAYKAAFDISLMVDRGDTAISNGAQLSDTPGPEPGRHTLTFATTRRMSTYLVALIVGDFVCRAGTSDGTPVRVCSTPDKENLTAFALEAAEQQLAFYNQYFGIKYPFGKLDIIAIPDFAAGAMENAGAITFRERMLLADPEHASIGTRKNVAAVLAHEIAHQWFGNLVTMKWWDDIWLNEGFATWITSKPVAAWRPDWKVYLDDASETQSALGLDALRTTRAIRMDVETPEEINEVFDGIAYEKTAGVLRMVEGFVGADLFRKGISSYLTKYSYSNAAGEDFWNEMTRVTGQPIDRIMKSFVEQPGAPVISVETRCTGRTAELTLTQDRFVGAPDASPPRTRQTWIAPVCFKGDGRARCEVLDSRQKTVSAPSCTNVFANADSRGYYFTEYAPDAVRALGRTAGSLAPVERLSLLSDEWWMVRAGRHDIGVYLDLAAGLATDETAAVIDAIGSRLPYTGEYIAAPADRAAYQAWIRQRFGPVLESLGPPGSARDDEERQTRRAELLTLVGGAGNDLAVQKRAYELAVNYLADRTSLAPTLAGPVLRIAARAGGAALYEQYLAQLQKLTAQPEEYYRVFGALPAFTEPALAQRTLAYAISPAVRTQDTGTLIAGLLGGSASREAAWAFVKKEWPTLTRTLGTFQGIPGIVGALGSFCSTADATDIRAFFAKNPVPSASRALQRSLERIDTCVALAARQSPALASWLKANRL
jgi:aminopeptidase N